MRMSNAEMDIRCSQLAACHFNVMAKRQRTLRTKLNERCIPSSTGETIKNSRLLASREGDGAIEVSGNSPSPIGIGRITQVKQFRE